MIVQLSAKAVVPLSRAPQVVLILAVWRDNRIVPRTLDLILLLLLADVIVLPAMILPRCFSFALPHFFTLFIALVHPESSLFMVICP